MKKLMTLMLGVAFAFTTVAPTFAQEKKEEPKKEEKKGKKKAPKKEGSEPEKKGGSL